MSEIKVGNKYIALKHFDILPQNVDKEIIVIEIKDSIAFYMYSLEVDEGFYCRFDKFFERFREKGPLIIKTRLELCDI